MEESRGERPGAVALPGADRDTGRTVPIGRHGRPAEEIASIQRERILDAFVREVGRRGFERVHVADVCAAAGVSTRGFYSVFQSKEECFLAAFDIGARIICAQAMSAYAGAKGPWENRIRTALGAVLETLAANPDFARLSIVEVHHAGPAATRALNAVIRQFQAILGGPSPLVAPHGLPTEAWGGSMVGCAFRPLVEYVEAGRVQDLPNLLPVMIYGLALPTVGEERAIRQLAYGAAGGPDAP